MAAIAVLVTVGCGGSVAEPGPATGGGGPTTTTGGGKPSGGTADTPATATATATSTAQCANAEPVLVPNGGTLVRPPTGSVLRLELVYQGDAIGILDARDVDMVISPSDGPFTAGANSGYWAEVRDASGAASFTRLFQDPTNIEGPGPGPGDLVNATIDRCTAKLILLSVPNDASATSLVVFGSPYGTEGAASELARFTLR